MTVAAMTEAEWLNPPEPGIMLAHLQGRVSDRRLRLLACAYARLACEFLSDERSLKAVIVAEEYDDGMRTEAEREQAKKDAYDTLSTAKKQHSSIPPEGEEDLRWTEEGRKARAHLHLLACVFFTLGDFGSGDGKRTTSWLNASSTSEELGKYFFESGVSHPQFEEQWEDSQRLLARKIIEVFNNPFRPVTVDPAWLTSTVLSLARHMYETRDFSPMPILADALMDAGCEEPAVLAHCRSEEPHVRGCWLIDLLLGKA